MDTRARPNGLRSLVLCVGSDEVRRFHACHGILQAKDNPMPLYFFDSGDGESFLRSDAGVELAGLQEARDEAVRLLPSIAHDLGARYNGQDIVSMVRDEKNQVVFKATLSLRAEWLVPHPEKKQRLREHSHG